MRTAAPRLIGLSPGDLDAAGASAFLERARAARSGGLAGLLLRESSMSDRDLLALARALRDLFSDGWLALHDRAHLAAPARADALHLGFRSLPSHAVCSWLAPRIALGLSTHAHDDPASFGALDYVFHGPVLATPSKQGFLEPIGFENLARAAARSGAALWAIGGLGPEHARAALAAGARGIAVRRGVLGAEDPAAAARAYLRALAS